MPLCVLHIIEWTCNSLQCKASEIDLNRKTIPSEVTLQTLSLKNNRPPRIVWQDWKQNHKSKRKMKMQCQFDLVVQGGQFAKWMPFWIDALTNGNCSCRGGVCVSFFLLSTIFWILQTRIQEWTTWHYILKPTEKWTVVTREACFLLHVQQSSSQLMAHSRRT